MFDFLGVKRTLPAVPNDDEHQNTSRQDTSRQDTASTAVYQREFSLDQGLTVNQLNLATVKISFFENVDLFDAGKFSFLQGSKN